VTEAGLRCDAGDFFVDPWQPVDRAIITHAHSDHARGGSASYLTSAEGRALLAHRLPDASIASMEWGDSVLINDVRVSLHPAGHIRGSAQVRVEHRGEVWVAAGDYKRDGDPTCTPFEVQPCHTFITEATFALPIYRWQPVSELVADILGWAGEVRSAGGCAILLTYALGKSQRVLAELAPYLHQPVLLHGALEAPVALYRAAGVALPDTRLVREARAEGRIRSAVVLAPPGAVTPGWLRNFHDPMVAAVSGWTRLRGARRRLAADRGFALSDHADWPGLLRTIHDSGANRVLATHGDSEALVRVLRERGLDAEALPTPFAAAGEEELPPGVADA
jgi:putative mRNA 3-end processing factor